MMIGDRLIECGLLGCDAESRPEMSRDEQG